MFCDGLRTRFAGTHVRVLDIKPGPVQTPMTAHLPKAAGFADPEAVGRTIADEIEHGAREVLYVPWKWKLIMAVVRAMPLSLMNRLKL
jgi:short-subunit dehydrogenase